LIFSVTDQLLLGALASGGVMLVLWIIQRRTGNAGVVDVAWSAGLGLMALFFALTSDGLPERRFLLAILAGGWSFRLAYYLIRDRVIGAPEDGRYVRLRESWGSDFQFKLLLFFEFQALLVLVFSLPYLVVAHNRQAGLSFLDLLGAAIVVLSISGEAVADRQLARFRNDPHNRGKTCRNGLWRYSRHPNYFFEWLHWWGYVLLGFGAAAWWLTFLGPALMLVFLYKITGIPATEEQALSSRGEDYRRYQETTSQFFPWFPREDAR
jgi:steroid 5-alpha reductase family enzyme